MISLVIKRQRKCNKLHKKCSKEKFCNSLGVELVTKGEGRVVEVCCWGNKEIQKENTKEKQRTGEEI